MKKGDCFVVVYVYWVEFDASRVARGGIRIGWISTGGSNATRPTDECEYEEDEDEGINRLTN